MSLAPANTLLLAGLLTAGAALLAAAGRVRIPYPILLVIAGAAIGFIPGVPDVRVSPEVVLVGVLPALLFGSAVTAPVRELGANWRPISRLAVGLVLATAAVVAVVAHAVIPGMGWAVAFTLGAIVGPTDPMAAVAVGERLHLPRRLLAVVDGEGLVNDGTSLTAYRYAVAAVAGGAFSLAHAAGAFVLAVIGGIAVGLLVGYVVRLVRRRLDDPPVEIAISLAGGYLAYLSAGAVGVSGVLAAVAAGVYVAWHGPDLSTAQTRLAGIASWNVIVVVLNALLFGLLGLQFQSVLAGVSQYSAASLLGYAAAVTAAVTGTRFVWVLAAGGLRGWRESLVLAWSGMRAAVSLAAALALPLTTDGHTAFPHRDLLIFLAFSVIVGTLLLQGLTLPALIRALGMTESETSVIMEAQARAHAAEAALARLDEVASEDWVESESAARLQKLYGLRRDSLKGAGQSDRRLIGELLEAQRTALLELRKGGCLDDDVLRKILWDIDLEEARFG